MFDIKRVTPGWKKKKRGAQASLKSSVNVERVKRLMGMSPKALDWQSRLFIHHFLCSRPR